MTTHTFPSSSNVREADYNPDTQELLVRFHSGDSYRHYGVPPRIVQDWLHAESAGKFYNAKLKGQFKR